MEGAAGWRFAVFYDYIIQLEGDDGKLPNSPGFVDDQQI